MRPILLMAVLAALAACSPTTDITRTSTEGAAGRVPYQVFERQPSGDFLRVKMRVSSMRAARIVAEDVIVRARARFQRVEVNVFGPADDVMGSPSAVLDWSTRGGFVWHGR